MHEAKQCRQLARAPVLDGAPRAATRTFPAMITISGQAQPNGLGGNHICRPVAGDHFASLNAPSCVRQLQQNSPLHAISPVNLDQNSIAPPTLRRSHDETLNEAETLAAWRANFAEADALPPLLGALLLARAWRKAERVQRQAWLAPLLAGLYLRRRGRTKAHLMSFTLGLRLLRPKPRAGRTLVEQLLQDLAILEVAARESLAQHDRLMLAKALLARKGRGRRQTSALPRLAALLLDSPLVNVPMIAETLKISPQAAQILVRDLGPTLREITGRQRYRAWTIG